MSTEKMCNVCNGLTKVVTVVNGKMVYTTCPNCLNKGTVIKYKPKKAQGKAKKI